MLIDDPLSAADHEREGYVGNDTSIDFLTTALPNDTVTCAWDFWPDAPTFDCRAINPPIQTEEAAPSCLPVSPTTALLFATTPKRNGLISANQSTLDDSSRASPILNLEPRQQSQTNANLTRQTTSTSVSASRSGSIHRIRR